MDTGIISEGKKGAAIEGRTFWTRCAVLGAVCALVIGVYAWSANSGRLESFGSGARDSYYNLQVQGFRAGQLNVKREAPPELVQTGHLVDSQTNAEYLDIHGLHDLSYYKGKLYLYFGVTPALVLFWPYTALTGHYLLHKDAALIFFSAGFLAGAGLLCAIWRRYFPETGFWVVVMGAIALGLASFIPAMIAEVDVYEAAISCGYALTMLTLVGIWRALHDERHQWRWLAAASLAYGLAVGARPSLLFGAIILLVPVAQGWREKRPLWPLLLAACGPIVLIGLGLMIYNTMRFDNPLEFGQRYQLPVSMHQQFSLRYLWYNVWVGFLEPAHWSRGLPFGHYISSLAPPKGYFTAENSFGVMTNIPFVWLALAAPLAWRRRPVEARLILRWFLAAAALLFGTCALILCLHDSMCLRYEVEFTHTLMLLAVIGILGLERALAGQPVWRRATRCGWGLMLAFSTAFNLLAIVHMQADAHTNLGYAFAQQGRIDEAIVQFHKALQIEPRHAPAHYNLGVSLAQTRRWDEAMAQYQEALQIKPDNAAAHCSLGIAFSQKGRADDALSQFQLALQADPNYAPAQFNLGNALLQAGKVDEAITRFQNVLQIHPGYAPAYYNLGEAFLEAGKVDEAIVYYQKAFATEADPNETLQIPPDYAKAHYNFGNALLQKGKTDEAITQYQSALQINPRYADAHLNIGGILMQKGKIDEAITQFQQELQIAPNSPQALNNLAWLLATCPNPALRNGRKAVELATQANTLTGGENPIVLHTLAAAFAEAGRFGDAVQSAQKAMALARAAGQQDLAGHLNDELKRYEAGLPLHQ